MSGFSYEEAAEICGCAVGTIKSRVARARETLLELLEGRQPLAAVPDEDLHFEDYRPITLAQSGPRRVDQAQSMR